MGWLKAAGIGLLVGLLIGAGVTGYIAWNALRGAGADVAEANANLDAVSRDQRRIEKRAVRLADELQRAATALRASRERVGTLEQLLADSGDTLGELGGGIGRAEAAASEQQELIRELARELEKLRGRPP